MKKILLTFFALFTLVFMGCSSQEKEYVYIKDTLLIKADDSKVKMFCTKERLPLKPSLESLSGMSCETRELVLSKLYVQTLLASGACFISVDGMLLEVEEIEKKIKGVEEKARKEKPP